MIKFFSCLVNMLHAGSQSAAKGPVDHAWLRDPLFHPVIAAMDEREIADLPLHQVGPAASQMCGR